MPSAAVAEFLLDPELTFLNHGSFGACPRSVLAAQTALRERLERDPVRFLALELEGLLDGARREAAAFVDVDPEDFVFVSNATSAVNAVLSSLTIAAGDEILVTDHGYAACRNAVEHRVRRDGARVVEARLPWPVTDGEAIVEAVLAKVSPRTRLALLDHVTSPSAVVLPIARLVAELRARGVPTLIDGAHAPGMLPFSVRELGAAYYTGNFHKWCCAPKGSGFLAVAAEQRASLRPLVISHGASAERPGRPRTWLEFDWLGTDDPTAHLAVPHALSFLRGALPGGVDALFAHNRELAREARSLLIAGLGAIPAAPEVMLGSMATVILQGDNWPSTEALYFRLLNECRIQVPVFSLPGRSERLVRVSAQVYNSLQDYERLVGALAAIGGS